MREGTTIVARVTPRGGRDAIEGRDGDGTLRVRVAAAPAGGKANDTVIRLVARALGVAPTRVTITSGGTSRTKRLRIEGITRDDVARKFAEA